MKLINQRSINRSLNPLLLGLLISTLTACYEELDLESLCHPLSSNCAEKDFDGDGVINRLDEFPIDPSCSKNDHQNCGRCGNACGVDAFCNIDQECEAIKAELCNGRDDDGNQLVDDNKALAKNQVGVCQGSLRICVNGKEEDADYQKISGYEEVEGLCDGLDNDCDGTVDENLRDIPLTNNQIGVCEGALKVCQGRMGYLDQYDQISGYLIEDTSCDGLDNDCDGKLDESVDLMLLEKQLGICQGLREVCALAEGIVIDYEQSEDYQEVETKCDGLDNDCDGVVDEELLDIPLTTNQVGVCMNALKSCDGANGFVDHYQLLATYQEIEGKCDGLDNDCDGVVDEELLDIPLTTNQVGVCMNALKSCDGANGFVDRYQLLAAYQEIEGRCDGLDNDCDGVVDETLLDVPLTTNQTGVCMNALKSCDGANGFVDHYQLLATYQEIEGQCDGLDNDCDGVVDEELLDIPLTTNQVGVCMNALKSCDGANGFVDHYQLLATYQEIEGKCDGLDNDCDGVVDEELLDIPLTTNQVGVCMNALKSCDGANGFVDHYQLLATYQEIEGQCDGLDNDCDGVVDEELLDIPLTTNQVGVCMNALKSCDGANGFVDRYQLLAAYQEIEGRCDGLDNDCDGVVDETLLDVPLTTNQTGVCMNALKSCDGANGFVDHYQLLATYQEIEGQCDGLDNDCDGVVDEELIDIPLTTNQVGVCMNALKSCDGANGFVDQYRLIVNYESLEVSCDRQDNDCDGRIDEGIFGCCGNGTIDDGEECDDNNVSNTDGCLMSCQNASCGDGFIQEEVEQCDDGNNVNTDACTNSCNSARCGDGIVQLEVEACDDGNSVNTDACISCAVARCGDGFVLAGSEQCDDGNSVNTDSCTNACNLARCGDGFVQMGEACDDGNSLNTDSCTNACNLARCGDGFVQMGEACDDGNSLNTDSCTNACNLARCGDGFVQAGEACDDGNINNRDNCSNSCFITCDANCPAMEMILIQAGSFNMGSNTSTYEQPIHNVQIRSNFYVGKTEVTVGQYRACVNAGQCTEPNTSSSRCNWTSSIGTKETHPVNCVDWNQARTFAKWIGGDLLTEAQWEYVATGQGQAITYPWGNAAPTCQLANHVYFNGTYYSYCVVVGSTAPVCSTTGGNTTQDVCDMGGNVWEWVLDEYHGSYSGAPSDDIGWCSDRGCESNTSELRINRGGGWDYEALYLRSARRNHSSPGDRHESLGFRVSRSIP